MTYFHLTLKSANAKTGPIPVTVTGNQSCPKSCIFKSGLCYAKSGPLAIHWSKVTDGYRGTDFKTFCKKISELPKSQIFRHNAAGDLPGRNDKINFNHLKSLVAANRGKRGFTYTHYPVINHKFSKENKKAVKYANKNGFTINLSGNNLAHADKLKRLNIAPVVCVIPIGSPDTLYTPAGNKVIKCPAQRKDKSNVTCKSCQLCQKSNRSVMVGFESHGIQKGKVNLIAGSDKY